MSVPVKLVVGLCNPGSEYEKTRHNAGAWLVKAIAESYRLKFFLEKKFKGWVTAIDIDGHSVWLLLPNTYMNNSGQAVQLLANFYKISPEEILIVHDELDFPAGVIRLKKDGSSGGHNGLKDIISALNSPHFYRLRIGIGRPKDHVRGLDYVLSPPNKAEMQLIQNAINDTLPLLPDLIAGKFSQVMQQLHT